MFRRHIRGMRNVARTGSSFRESQSLSDTSCLRPLTCLRDSEPQHLMAHRAGAAKQGTCPLVDQSWFYVGLLLEVRQVASNAGRPELSYDQLRFRGLARHCGSRRMLAANRYCAAKSVAVMPSNAMERCNGTEVQVIE
jgi:hypothetical protein